MGFYHSCYRYSLRTSTSTSNYSFNNSFTTHDPHIGSMDGISTYMLVDVKVNLGKYMSVPFILWRDHPENS